MWVQIMLNGNPCWFPIQVITPSLLLVYLFFSFLINPVHYWLFQKSCMYLYANFIAACSCHRVYLVCLLFPPSQKTYPFLFQVGV